MADKLRFNKRSLEALPFAERGRTEHRDSETPGLILVVGTRSKVFYVYRRIQGRPTRYKLGVFPDLTVEAARKAAAAALGEIAADKDPAAIKRATKARGTTLGGLFETYLDHRALKPRTAKAYRDEFRLTFEAWRNKPLAEITRNDVQELHRKRSKATAAGANHAMRILRALFNYAIETLEDERGEPLFHSNPVKRLSATKSWNRIERRQTVIKPHQLPAWFEAVQGIEGARSDSNAATARDFLLFVLFTGLRKLEAARLTWDRVDLPGRAFTITDTKNGDPHSLPLSDFLVGLLECRAGTATTDFVFPAVQPPGSQSTDKRAPGHIVDPRFWTRRVAEQSGVSFTVHDLRRTFITAAESLDIPAYALKRLLNHRAGGDVTAGYLVIDVERLRRPMQQITDYLLIAGGMREGAQVHRIGDPLRPAAPPTSAEAG